MAENRTRGETGGGTRFVSGLILAAGRSTRMGRPKTELMLEDRTLLQHVIDNVATSCVDETVVVVGPAARDRSAVHAPARAVVNATPQSGQTGSLGLGLDAVAAEAEAVAVLLADQPGVGPELIDRIVQRAGESEAAIVRPVHTEGTRRVPGHPVVIRRDVFAAISAEPHDSYARDWIRAHPEYVEELAIDGPRPDDIDTPEDYERALGAPQTR